MKLFRHAFLLLTTVIAVGCYDYDRNMTVEDIETLRDITQCFNARGKAWLTFNLQLSQPQPMTRANSYTDGDAADYAIKTLTLVLFHGAKSASEDQLTVASIYTMDYTPVSETHPQVTDHTTATIEISNDNINSGDRLFFLAIANTLPEIVVGETFATLKNSILDNVSNMIDNTRYFVMSNSPLASANNGTGTVSTLTAIKASQLYESSEGASSNPISIYMERAAAKVTVTESVTPKTIVGNPDIDFSTSDIKFALYNYNDRSYLVRHFDAIWLSYNNNNIRMVDSTALPNGQYRTYWSEDVNYTNRNNIRTIDGWSAMSGSYYCAENTFGVDYMADANTTSVVVRIQLNGGNDFYTTSVTGSDIIYQTPANEVSEEGTSASSSFSRRNSSKVTSAKTIDEYLREWLMQTNAAFRSWVNSYASGESRHVNIAVYTGDAGLTDAKVTAVTQTAQGAGSAGSNAFEALNLKTYFDNNISINYYRRGYCFYRVPIRHFTDSETPWQSAVTMTDNTATQAYASNEENYLGRYGVVRNNWYTVNITGVSHVGAPAIPQLTFDADDKVEQLLNTTLQVSGWTENSSDL